MIPNLKKFREVAASAKGNLSKIAEAFNVARSTVYFWMEKNEKFRQSIEDEREKALDLTEDVLMTNIAAGDVASTIFMLKTRGKKRGYSERSEMDVTTNGKDIAPVFNFVDLEKLTEIELNQIRENANSVKPL